MSVFCCFSLCGLNQTRLQILLLLILTDENVFVGKISVHALCNGARNDQLDLIRE